MRKYIKYVSLLICMLLVLSSCNSNILTPSNSNSTPTDTTSISDEMDVSKISDFPVYETYFGEHEAELLSLYDDFARGQINRVELYTEIATLGFPVLSTERNTYQNVEPIYDFCNDVKKGKDGFVYIFTDSDIQKLIAENGVLRMDSIFIEKGSVHLYNSLACKYIFITSYDYFVIVTENTPSVFLSLKPTVTNEIPIETLREIFELASASGTGTLKEWDGKSDINMLNINGLFQLLYEYETGTDVRSSAYYNETEQLFHVPATIYEDLILKYYDIDISLLQAARINKDNATSGLSHYEENSYYDVQNDEYIMYLIPVSNGPNNFDIWDITENEDNSLNLHWVNLVPESEMLEEAIKVDDFGNLDVPVSMEGILTLWIYDDGTFQFKSSLYTSKEASEGLSNR